MAAVDMAVVMGATKSLWQCSTQVKCCRGSFLFASPLCTECHMSQTVSPGDFVSVPPLQSLQLQSCDSDHAEQVASARKVLKLPHVHVYNNCVQRVSTAQCLRAAAAGQSVMITMRQCKAACCGMLRPCDVSI